MHLYRLVGRVLVVDHGNIDPGDESPLTHVHVLAVNVAWPDPLDEMQVEAHVIGDLLREHEYTHDADWDWTDGPEVYAISEPSDTQVLAKTNWWVMQVLGAERGPLGEFGWMGHSEALVAKYAVDTIANRRRDMYFILDPSSGRVKIGVTGNVRRRWRELNQASSVDLTLLGVIRGVDFVFEQTVHARWQSLYCKNEWFLFSDDLRRWIGEQSVLPKEDFAPLRRRSKDIRSKP